MEKLKQYKLTRIVASSSSRFTAPESNRLTFCFSASDLPAKEELADLGGFKFLLLGIDSRSNDHAQLEAQDVLGSRDGCARLANMDHKASCEPPQNPCKSAQNAIRTAGAALHIPPSQNYAQLIFCRLMGLSLHFLRLVVSSVSVRQVSHTFGV